MRVPRQIERLRSRSQSQSTAELPEENPEVRELRAERAKLIEKFTVMQTDLGGAFYEMAIRNHVKMDVLTRKAAELQRVDAELLAVERSLQLLESSAAGLCAACGSPFALGTQFCSQCGSPLSSTITQAPAPPSGASGPAPSPIEPGPTQPPAEPPNEPPTGAPTPPPAPAPAPPPERLDQPAAAAAPQPAAEAPTQRIPIQEAG